MTLTERSAYIKGLAEGLGIDETSKEGKLIRALIDLTAEMAEVIAEQAEDIETLNDYIEEIDEDLGDVEEVLLDMDDECECDCDCEDCDCDCDDCACDCCCDDEDYYEILCPSCGETVCFDESVNAEELICPACGSELGCIVEDDDIEPVEE